MKLKSMNVQELIDQLSLIKDKSKLVINEYDAWYTSFRSLATIDLYTSDHCINLYNSHEEAKGMSNEEETVITKHCILIDTSNGKRESDSYHPQKYFYTSK